jgi:hypothetical protein
MELMRKIVIVQLANSNVVETLANVYQVTGYAMVIKNFDLHKSHKLRIINNK